MAARRGATGIVKERLSYDAWGLRRHPDGTPDPSGSIVSQSTRGFTGHEHLAEVGLIHMNGRVYDPLLARFGTPDPTTESPFSTQGWNRYTYVGNSPVNFTDPPGYCFLGCFWKPIFKAIGNFFKQAWSSILQVAATALLCAGPTAPICAGVIAFAVTGVASGDLGLALRAGVTAAFTAAAMDAVGTATLGEGHPSPEFMSPAHVANIAGHALVGCASAVMNRAKCGPGALSGAAGSFAGPALADMGMQRNLVARSVVGGLASVAGGGKFANGAVTAAFGYLFNDFGEAIAATFGFRSASELGAYAQAAPAMQAANDAARAPPDAYGASIEFSWINPLTSNEGGVYGYNYEYTPNDGWKLYKYYTPENAGSVGFSLGISFQGNIAWGSGEWAGLFDGVSGGRSIFAGGTFWSPPGEGNWFGLSGGFAAGPPGLGYTRTDYYKVCCAVK